jgi:hypothetical protein
MGGARGLPAPVTGLYMRTPPGNWSTAGISARTRRRPANCPVSRRTPSVTRGRTSVEAAVRTVASTKARSSWPRAAIAARWWSSSSPVGRTGSGFLAGGFGRSYVHQVSRSGCSWVMVATPSAVGADEDGLQVLLGQGVGELFPVEDVGDDPSRIDPAGAGGWSSGGGGHCVGVSGSGFCCVPAWVGGSLGVFQRCWVMRVLLRSGLLNGRGSRGGGGVWDFGVWAGFDFWWCGFGV